MAKTTVATLQAGPIAPTKSRKAKQAPLVSDTRLKAALTITMGCGIPLASLALSTIAGTLARTNHLPLAGLAFALMACVLAVSLGHLAWAIEDITRSPGWASWLLAIAFDLALVHGELVHVNASDAGLGWLCGVLMVAVCGLSMTLNCWAFFRHPAKPAKKKAK